jgi:hypothetical protein
MGARSSPSQMTFKPKLRRLIHQAITKIGDSSEPPAVSTHARRVWTLSEA